MRQQQWVEFLKDCDFVLKYHPGKANMVVDALIRKSLHMFALMIYEMALLESFRDRNLKVKSRRIWLVLSHIQVSSSLRDSIRQAQKFNSYMQDMKGQPGFSEDGDGIICFNDRICVPQDKDLKNQFLVHPGSTKMYCGLKQLYWQLGMKTDIAEFVSQCLTCKEVKIEHQKPSGQLTVRDS